MGESFKYWAFISYSHKDKAWADWLHKSLESYRVPRKLVGQSGRDGIIPKRIYPVFRDREELPTSANLGSNIDDALRMSRYLIVVCSPNAANSTWVNQEIKTFKAQGKADRVLCLIINGEPNATYLDQRKLLECFPKAIRFEVDSHENLTDVRAEPIAADLRSQGDGKTNAKLKLLAGLLGVNFDDLKQRDKRIRRTRKILFSIVVVVIALIIVTTAFIFEQQQQKRDFQHVTHALSMAKNELENGDKSLGVLLSQYAVSKAQTLSLGKFTDWAERLLDIPISGRAETQRQLSVASQTQLSQAVSELSVEQQHLSLDGSFQSLISLSYSADGKWLLSSEEYSNGELNRGVRIRLWDVTTAKQKLVIERKDANVRDIAISPTNKFIVVYTSNSVELWSTSTGQRVHSYANFSAPLKGTIFQGSDKIMATWTDENHFDLWNLETGGLHRTLSGHTGAVTWVSFSRDGQQLASTAKDGFTKVWDVATGDLVTEFEAIDGYPTYVEFDNSSTQLVTRNIDKKAHVLKLKNANVIELSGHEYQFGEAHFSHDDRLIVTTDYPDFSSSTRKLSVRIWDARNGKLLYDLPNHWNFEAPSAKFLSAENRVVTRSDVVRVWDSMTGKIISVFDETNFAIDRSGRRVAIQKDATVVLTRLVPKSGDLDSYIDKMIRKKLSEDDIRLLFPEAPPLLGY